MNKDSERTPKNSSIDARQLTKNQRTGRFLRKVRRELWNSGDFHIAGELKNKSDHCILTDEGEIEDSEDSDKPHLEISVKDAENLTAVPGLDIEAVIMQNGETIKDTIDLSFLCRPNEAVYIASVDIEEGIYDIQLNINNNESDEEIQICFEKMGYMT